MDSLLNIVFLLITIYTWLIVAQALLSWFPMRPGTLISSINDAVRGLTDPYLSLFRRFLPTPRVGTVGIDLSAIVGLLVLIVAMQVLGRLTT
ncbi:MAG TPA: YggT family protein [Thermoleophilia bacterium]|nr:YggT family protein [Thermoleophilia bacterium]